MALPKKCGIYKITSPSKRTYIGQSTDIARRFRSYRGNYSSIKAQVKLYASLQKHGADNHVFEIIQECNSEDLNEIERYYIELYNSFDKLCGLNISRGMYTPMSDETKIKIGIANTGKKMSDDARKRMSDKGKMVWSEERRKKMSEFQKSIPHKDKGRHYEKKRVAKIGGNNPNARKVINIATNELFNTIKEASISLSIKYATLWCYLVGSRENKTSMRFL
jgi:group I intron endonuclease